VPEDDLRSRLRLMAIADAEVAETTVRGWARGGVTALQLRDKSSPPEAVLTAARRLAALCRDLGLLFLLNDRAEWQPLTGAPGVHLGWSDLPEQARRHLGPGAVLGISASTPEQARRAAALGADYLGVGPVFATASKPDAGTPLGLAGLAAVRRAVPYLPLVAVGGIAPDTVREVLAAGADGVAAIAALAAGDPETAAAAFTVALHAVEAEGEMP
jgi:thiamine-phosphate pyrophosphorylase